MRRCFPPFGPNAERPGVPFRTLAPFSCPVHSGAPLSIRLGPLERAWAFDTVRLGGKRALPLAAPPGRRGEVRRTPRCARLGRASVPNPWAGRPYRGPYGLRSVPLLSARRLDEIMKQVLKRGIVRSAAHPR